LDPGYKVTACAMGGQDAVPDEGHFAQCADHGIGWIELTIMDGYIQPGDAAMVDAVGRLAR
jgi:hypothetical protein